MNCNIDKSVEVISFDIFDTLLLRPYSDPQYLWKVLETREKANGFYFARKSADIQTYQLSTSQNRETSIEEAYDLIPQFAHLMKKEIELEKQVLRANCEMLDFWNWLGNQKKRRIIISDMYLPSNVIKSILRDNGIDGWDAFYLSRDYNARKSTGELFKQMLKEQNVKPEQVLHIGDNKKSDVIMPSKLGIKTLHYSKIIDNFYKECPFSKYLDSEVSGILAQGWHSFKYSHPDYTYWNRLGFIVGGIMGYCYMQWIGQVLAQNKKNHVLFVARDGYIWETLFKELFPNIRTDYVYAPRPISIAVLGAIGADPNAIKDRQDYLKKHFEGIDIDKISEEYRKYLLRFKIDENTVLVDGCSSGFSAQRLIEKVMDLPVQTFYLVTMARKNNTASLFSTDMYFMPFQEMSEFIFGAPTPPAFGIHDGCPLFNENVSKYESFKMSVSNEIAEGALHCVKYLKTFHKEISPLDCVRIIDAFMLHLSKVDKAELKKAKNATDVKQAKFRNVRWNPNAMFQIKTSGRMGFKLSFMTKNKKYEILVSPKNGIKYTGINRNYRVCEIIN